MGWLGVSIQMSSSCRDPQHLIIMERLIRNMLVTGSNCPPHSSRQRTQIITLPTLSPKSNALLRYQSTGNINPRLLLLRVVRANEHNLGSLRAFTSSCNQHHAVSHHCVNHSHRACRTHSLVCWQERAGRDALQLNLHVTYAGSRMLRCLSVHYIGKKDPM